MAWQRPDMSVKVKCAGCSLKFMANLVRAIDLSDGSAGISRPCPYCEVTNVFEVTDCMTPQTEIPGRAPVEP